MSTDCLKLENNLCRCCHAEGAFKTLGVSIGTQGREVYADMLRVYLDVNLTPVPGPLCLVTYTICEECVQRLYDAVDFKKQILECEERFRDMYRRDVIKACKPDIEVKLEVDATDIPSTFVEELKVECNPEINEIDDDTDFEYPDTAEVDAPEEAPKEQQAKTKDLDGKKEDDSKKKDKGKGKAKVVKTGKKIGRPKKSETGAGDKKTKKEESSILLKLLLQHGEVNKRNPKKYPCPKCKTLHSSVEDLKHHTANCHFIPCPLCNEKFEKEDLKERHLTLLHAVKQIRTDDTVTLQSLREHVCEICKKEFHQKSLLDRHLNKAHKKKFCTLCKILISSKEFLVHKNQVHGESIPTCGICGYKNVRKSSVIVHQKIVHMKEKRVKCEHCDMMFYDTQRLRKHSVKHKADKVFECKFCHKKFPRKSTMRLHEKIHTGEKNKACLHCDQRFVQKASLNYHMVKYHPEKC